MFDRILRHIGPITFLLKNLVCSRGYPLSTHQIWGTSIGPFARKKFQNFLEKVAIAIFEPPYTGSGKR